jgi:hypothetical protein
MPTINYDNYYLGFVEGVMGMGKTIRLVAEIIENYKKYDRIYANFKVKLPNNQDKFIYVPKITGPIIKGFEENSLFAIHEGYKDLDCRYCMEKRRKEIIEAIMQIRKDRTEIIVDIISLLWLDFRIIGVGTNFYQALGRLYPQYYEFENTFYYREKIPIHIGRNEYEFIDGKRLSSDMSKYFDCYNTREKSGRIQKMLNH